MAEQRRNIIIITADRGSGKTTFIKRFVSYLKNGGISHAGFFAEGTWDGEERRGFSLHLLPAGEILPLCDRVTESWTPMGRFRYNPGALKRGFEAVKNASAGDIILMDEIGLQESWGCVWADALTEAVKKKNPLILSVQYRNLDEIIRKWDIAGADVFNGNITPWEKIWNVIVSQRLCSLHLVE